MYYYLEEIGIFLLLTAKLAGNCALNVIFACVFVCLCVYKGSVGGCTFFRRESVCLSSRFRVPAFVFCFLYYFMLLYFCLA